MPVQIRSGDTLSGLAARHGTSVSALLRANPQIHNPNLIHAGQQLRLPGEGDSFQPSAPASSGGQRYTVRAGDSLSAIGSRFGVSYQSIAQANGISNPNRIYAGQQLVIPGARTPAPAPAPAPSNPAPSGASYTVQPGDSLSGIGARFGVSYQAIAQANGITNPNRIYPGQRLTIPGRSGPAPVDPTPAPTPNGGSG